MIICWREFRKVVIENELFEANPVEGSVSARQQKAPNVTASKHSRNHRNPLSLSLSLSLSPNRNVRCERRFTTVVRCT